MRSSRRDAPGGPVPLDGHLVRSDAWAGLRRGDAVVVTGTRLRSANWELVAHVRNSRTGDEWVEVVGGRAGERTVRSFRPEQVFPYTSRRRAGGAPASPSLADAPQLPLA